MTPAGPPPMIDTTDLTMWYKGYEGVLIGGVPPVDGGTIDQVENQNGTTDALQTVVGARPTWHDAVVNGKGIIRFDGVDDYLRVASGVDTNISHPLTLFFAINIPAFTSFTMLITHGISGAQQRYSTYIQPGGFAGRITYCANACREADGIAGDAGAWVRVIVRIDTGTANTRFYRNGVQVGLSGSVPAQTAYATDTLIGTRIDGFFNAYDLVEMGVFNRNLTDQEIVDLDAYLAGVVGA